MVWGGAGENLYRAFSGAWKGIAGTVLENAAGAASSLLKRKLQDDSWRILEDFACDIMNLLPQLFHRSVILYQKIVSDLIDF